MTSFFYFLRRLTQPAYRIKGIGLGRICEYVRRWAARHAPQTPLIVNNFRKNARFRCFLQEHMGGQIFFRGSYSGDQLTIVEKLLDAEGIFLDIGANQGEFSVAAARIVQQGKVIAFEPVSEYRNRLIQNIELNEFSNVQIVPFALGEQEGTLPIYDYDTSQPYSDGTRNEGLTTLFASEYRNNARELVRVRRLDNVLAELKISKVNLIKLDIEGAEWIALRGAVDTLIRCRPKLIFEIGRDTCNAAGYEPEALVEWLTNLNYRIEKIIEGGKTLPITPSLLDNFQNVVAYPT
jgi:FkbM family methyltransferase